MNLGAPLLSFLIAAGAAAQAAAPSPNFLPVKETKRGMKGYGLSVFQGTKVERFDVEVIGILTNALPKQDMILARMSGANLDKTGIIAGMSGSPVYLKVGDEDRLAGAVAYGWAFPKEPVCGITPFENMHAVIAAATEKSAAAAPAGAPGRLDGPITLGERTFTELTVASAPPAWDAAWSGGATLYRLQTPLLVSGFAEPAMALVRKEFGPLGFIPVQGGGAAATEENQNVKLEPGAALAVRFAEGDIEMSGVGTCTAVIGNTVLGFGHPMFGEGHVSVPMATAVVHYCFPSLMRSFKLASSVKTVGQLTADVQAAVMGTVGALPRMIPIEVRLHRADMQGQETFHCRVFDHPQMTPRIVGMFLLNSLVFDGEFPRQNTLRLRATLALAKRPPLVVDNVYSGLTSSQALMEALGDIVAPVTLLGNNAFGKVDVESITAEFQVTSEATTAAIDAVRLERNDYRPGETLRALVTLRPLRKEPFLQTLELKLPDDFPPENATVTVCDASTNERLDRAEAAYRYEPRDIDQLVELLREQTPQRRLYLRLQLPDRGVALRGIELPDLPPSMYAVVASPKVTGLSLTGKSLVAHADTQYVVSGTHTLTVLVRPRQTP